MAAAGDRSVFPGVPRVWISRGGKVVEDEDLSKNPETTCTKTLVSISWKDGDSVIDVHDWITSNQYVLSREGAKLTVVVFGVLVYREDGLQRIDIHLRHQLFDILAAQVVGPDRAQQAQRYISYLSGFLFT